MFELLQFLNLIEEFSLKIMNHLNNIWYDAQEVAQGEDVQFN